MKTRVIKFLLVFSLILSVFGLGAERITAEASEDEKSMVKFLIGVNIK